MVVVSTNGRQDTEESIVLGMVTPLMTGMIPQMGGWGNLFLNNLLSDLLSYYKNIRIQFLPLNVKHVKLEENIKSILDTIFRDRILFSDVFGYVSLIYAVPYLLPLIFRW